MRDSGGRPELRFTNKPGDDPEETRGPAGASRWPLGVSLLRGGFFMIAMVFTYASLVAMNYHRGDTFNIAILGGLSLLTLVMAFMGLLRCNFFEGFLAVGITITFMVVTWFEFGDDLHYLKNPEQEIRDVELKDIGKYPDARYFLFKDTRPVASEATGVETYEGSGSYYYVAPYVSTTRDSVFGDSVIAFVTGYSYDDSAFTEAALKEWYYDDLDVYAKILNDDWEIETYQGAINEWKKKYERASAEKPLLFGLTPFPYFNQGQEVKWLLFSFIGVLLAWIVVVTIERVILNAIRGAGT